MAESKEQKKRILQQAFQEAQRSYREAMESTFVHQVVALEFTRRLLEALEGTLPTREAEENRALLISLQVRATRQREELERLLRETNQTYMRTLRVVFEPPGEEA